MTKEREGKVGRKRVVGDEVDLGTKGKMGWGGEVSEEFRKGKSKEEERERKGTNVRGKEVMVMM